jgi:hypothetical protein
MDWQAFGLRWGDSAVQLPQQGRSQVQLGNEEKASGLRWGDSAVQLPRQGRSQVQLGNEETVQTYYAGGQFYNWTNFPAILK